MKLAVLVYITQSENTLTFKSDLLTVSECAVIEVFLFIIYQQVLCPHADVAIKTN